MARKKQITGLGDVIAVVTDAVGIKQCDECKQRQKRLNNLFSFGTKELTQDQKNYLQLFFEDEPKELNKETQSELLDIYFDVYKIKPFKVCTGCVGVWKNIIKKLKKLDYENSNIHQQL